MTKISAVKDLAQERINANKEIDEAAEAARIAPDRLTDGDGQQQEYQETWQEYQRYIEDSNPQESDYPMLVAEREAQIESGLNPNATLDSVAADVATQVQTWNQIGSAIKRERRKGKLRVNRSTSPRAITQAKNTAIAAIQAI